MKIYKIIILIITLVSFNCYSQTWEREYGETNKYEYSADIAESYDFGFSVLGIIDGSAGWLLKTDINGDTLWEKVLVTNIGQMVPSALAISTSNETIIVGSASNGINSYQNPMITKLNTCGEKEWCKILYKNGNAYAMDVISIDEYIFILTTQMGDNFNDRIHIYCLDTNGNVLWRKKYATIEDYPLMNSPQPTSFFKTSDGGFIILGYCYYPKIDNPTGPKVLRGLVIKTTADFEEEWVLPLATDSNIHLMVQTGLEDENEFIFFGENNLEYDRPFVLFADANGVENGYITIENDTVFNNAISYYFDGLSSKQENGDYIIGMPHRHDLNNTSNWGIIRTNIDFTILNTASNQNSFEPFTAKKTYDNKYIQVSKTPSAGLADIYMLKFNENLEYDSIYTQAYEYDYECDHPIESGVITFNDCNIIVGTNEIPTPKEYLEQKQIVNIQIAPNPAKEEISLRFENIEKHRGLQLRITSVLAQQIYETTLIKGQAEQKLNIRNWQKGVYLVQLYSNGKLVGKNRFVKM
jgi:hypothetical protein